jgi:hypothetical protein
MAFGAAAVIGVIFSLDLVTKTGYNLLQDVWNKINTID